MVFKNVFARNQILLNVRPKLLEICAESGKKKVELAENREDEAGRGVPGGGEAETSLDTRMARLAAMSSVEVRSKNLGWGCGILGYGVRWSPELGEMGWV
jgi:hypothetical protein